MDRPGLSYRVSVGSGNLGRVGFTGYNETTYYPKGLTNLFDKEIKMFIGASSVLVIVPLVQIANTYRIDLVIIATCVQTALHRIVSMQNCLVIQLIITLDFLALLSLDALLTDLNTEIEFEKIVARLK